MDAKREVTVFYRGVPCKVLVNSLGEEVNFRLSTQAKERGVKSGLLPALPMEENFGAFSSVGTVVDAAVLKSHAAARSLFAETLESAAPQPTSGELLMEQTLGRLGCVCGVVGPLLRSWVAVGMPCDGPPNERNAPHQRPKKPRGTCSCCGGGSHTHTHTQTYRTPALGAPPYRARPWSRERTLLVKFGCRRCELFAATDPRSPLSAAAPPDLQSTERAATQICNRHGAP